ncbi:MAG: hypothetical protein V1929_00555 [bacterium]
MAKEEAAQATGESELWGAIAAFERILEVMPTDRLALETLADAYERLGDITRSSEYLVRLVDIVVSENDVQSASDLLEKFKSLGVAHHPEAVKSLESILAVEQGTTSAPEKGLSANLRKGPDITREVSLAWDLMQAGELSSDDYSAVVHDLSESSSKRIDVPVSVLHALHDRGYKGYDKIVAYLSRSSGLPVIPITGFEVLPAAYNLLPMDIMTQRGAICFETMGQDALVAVLNPFDKDLQEDACSAMGGRRCHFYLVSSSDYDAVLGTIRKTLKAAEAKAAEAKK